MINSANIALSHLTSTNNLNLQIFTQPILSQQKRWWSQNDSQQSTRTAVSGKLADPAELNHFSVCSKSRHTVDVGACASAFTSVHSYQ